jgi:hypothetical protein
MFYFLGLIIGSLISLFLYYTLSSIHDTSGLKHDFDIVSFEGFNNETGADRSIIPNIFHLNYLQTTQLKFYQMVNIFSIYLNQKPDLIYIHCDNCSFHGHRWERLMRIKDLKNRLVIHQVPNEGTIFGKPYGWLEHRADNLRLQVLSNYGGIYLDNDVYVINSLDMYRKFEMAVSWDDGQKKIGNQVLIAHKNARFLRAMLDQYRYNYNRSIWYYNGGNI